MSFWKNYHDCKDWKIEQKKKTFGVCVSFEETELMQLEATAFSESQQRDAWSDEVLSDCTICVKGYREWVILIKISRLVLKLTDFYP